MGLTRWRDLAVVCLGAAVVGYLLVRLNYARMPPLPRFAGVPAALVGLGEAVAGFGMRRRIRPRERSQRAGPARPPVQPLTAARAVTVAKATALAAAAFAGLWLGLLAYVLPSWSQFAAAQADGITGLVGLAGALVMVGGALFLERSCVAPRDR
jgi:hypothetical protein